VILFSECRALGEEGITTYFKSLRFDAAGTSGARPHDLPFAKQEHYHFATATGPLGKGIPNCSNKVPDPFQLELITKMQKWGGVI
jgi:hypothetical protein